MYENDEKGKQLNSLVGQWELDNELDNEKCQLYTKVPNVMHPVSNSVLVSLLVFDCWSPRGPFRGSRRQTLAESDSSGAAADCWSGRKRTEKGRSVRMSVLGCTKLSSSGIESASWSCSEKLTSNACISRAKSRKLCCRARASPRQLRFPASESFYQSIVVSRETFLFWVHANYFLMNI